MDVKMHYPLLFLFKVMYNVDRIRVYVVCPYIVVYVYMHVLRRFKLL